MCLSRRIGSITIFPAIVIACGMSLMPLSDSNVRVWDLNHSALKWEPMIGPNRRVTSEDIRERRESQRDEIARDFRSVARDVLTRRPDVRAYVFLVALMKRLGEQVERIELEIDEPRDK